MLRSPRASATLLAGVLALVAAPLALEAQGGPGRPPLDDLVRHVTLATAADVPALRAHTATTLPGLEGQLARAWVELALAERDSAYPRLADLADDFGRLAERHPDWGLANLGLARAALLMHGRKVEAAPTFAGALRGRHFMGYAFHLAQATRDPVQLGAGMGFLADRMVREGERLQPAEVMDAIRVLAERRDADARLDLVLARDARANDSAVAALEHLDRYLSRGGNAGIGHLERARTHAALGAFTEAVQDYRTGLADRSEAGRAAYRADLAWVASRAEMAAFDSLPIDSVVPWTERFWALRDARDFRARDARLAEHLRRWNAVHRHFRVWLADRRSVVTKLFITSAETGQACMDGPLSLDDILPPDPAPSGDARGDERILDHRAVLYMRHGEPLKRQWRTEANFVGQEFGASSLPEGRAAQARALQDALPSANPLAPMGRIEVRRPGEGGAAPAGDFLPSPIDTRDETWLYLIDGVPRIYHLSGSQALGVNTPTTLYTAVVPDQFTLAFMLAGLPLPYGLRNEALLDAASGRLQLMAEGMTRQPWFCSPQGRQWRTVLNEDATVAATTDGFAPRFPAHVAGSMRVYALGQPDAGTGRLVIAVGVDTRSLAPASASGVDARLFDTELRVATIDPRTAEREQRTGPVRFERRRDDPNASVVALMPLLPGHREVRVLVAQDTLRGSLYAADVAPAATGEALAVSDVIVGAEGLTASVTIGGRTVPVSAAGAFTSLSPIDLYYELYNLRAGATYRSRLVMRRTDGEAAREEVAVSFTDQATGPMLAAQRRLTLPDVPRGEYVLELTVTDPERGTSATRRQRIFILGR